jgi:hypothetical protein
MVKRRNKSMRRRYSKKRVFKSPTKRRVSRKGKKLRRTKRKTTKRKRMITNRNMRGGMCATCANPDLSKTDKERIRTQAQERAAAYQTQIKSDNEAAARGLGDVFSQGGPNKYGN